MCSAGEVGHLDAEFRRWFVVAAVSPVTIGLSSRAVDGYLKTLLSIDGGELYEAFSKAVAGRIVKHTEGVVSPDLEARAWVTYFVVWNSLPLASMYPKPNEKALNRYQGKLKYLGALNRSGRTNFLLPTASIDRFH